MRKLIPGFRRCPRCGTMQGPVAACPKCGWSEVCAWCGVRVWISGSGWTVSPSAGNATSHGMCPWCVVRQYGGDAAKVERAAERLGVPAGLLSVRRRRLVTGASFLTIHYDGVTGWAGVTRKIPIETEVLHV